MFGPPWRLSRDRGAIIDLVIDMEEGGFYKGLVIKIKNFGAIAELLRNKEGLLHISDIDDSPERRPRGQHWIGEGASQGVGLD